MRVILAATGKFHYFDLARQMARLGALTRLYTAYPHWKISESGLPDGTLNTFPWLHTLYMFSQRLNLLPHAAADALDQLDRVSFDAYVAKKLEPCDIFTAISGCGLLSGAKAKSHSAKYVCDRGSTHIEYQNKLLIEEYKEWGIPFRGIDNRIIERELKEYEVADAITVPSKFAFNSFVNYGTPASKISTIPYGVDLGQFEPTGSPNPKSLTLTYIGGVNLRKGIPYLTQAFKKIKTKNKTLRLIGQPDEALISRLRSLSLWDDNIQLLGHIPQAHLKHYLSSSDALVLPSIEDGFGLVIAQALACGCPVIASDHTGAPEIIKSGFNGFIIPARNASKLIESIEKIQNWKDPASLRKNARESVAQLNGWNQYGDSVFGFYQKLLS